MTYEISGFLKGVVVNIRDHGKGYVTLEVKSDRTGIICFVDYIFNSIRPLPFDIGSPIELEEARLSFDDGQVVYNIDEEQECISFN